jgi:hypothetical protein
LWGSGFRHRWNDKRGIGAAALSRLLGDQRIGRSARAELGLTRPFGPSGDDVTTRGGSDGRRLFGFAAFEHGAPLCLTTKAAGNTLSHGITTGPGKPGAQGRERHWVRRESPPSISADPDQSNSELTDDSSLIRRIASASKGAMVNCRMLLARSTSGVAWIESVIVIISIGESATRATAPPDSTPCVT